MSRMIQLVGMKVVRVNNIVRIRRISRATLVDQVEEVAGVLEFLVETRNG